MPESVLPFVRPNPIYFFGLLFLFTSLGLMIHTIASLDRSSFANWFRHRVPLMDNWLNFRGKPRWAPKEKLLDDGFTV